MPARSANEPMRNAFGAPLALKSASIRTHAASDCIARPKLDHVARRSCNTYLAESRILLDGGAAMSVATCEVTLPGMPMRRTPIQVAFRSLAI